MDADLRPLFLLSRFAYTPLVRWLKSLGVDEQMLQPMPFVFVLLITWICLHLRRERLADVGLRCDRAWWRQAAIGCLIGIGSAALAVGLLLLAGGAYLELDPQRSLAALLLGAHVFLFVSLFEELLFRGFLFQRLVAASRPWIAQVVFALLFAFGHWGNPEMEGVTRWIGTLEIALAAVLLGLAYLRTGSLALPIGLQGWLKSDGGIRNCPRNRYGSTAAASAWKHRCLRSPLICWSSCCCGAGAGCRERRNRPGCSRLRNGVRLPSDRRRPLNAMGAW